MVELRVNESALLQRVETRVAEMRARGEEVRIDDTPEVLSKRLASYRSLTEPLIHYYSERRKLLTVDGMMTIEHVTREINRILAAIGAVERQGGQEGAGQAGRQAAARRPPGRQAKGRQNRQKGRQKAAKGRRKAGESGLARRPKSRPGRPPRRLQGQRPAARRPRKAAKKVTKKRAKR